MNLAGVKDPETASAGYVVVAEPVKAKDLTEPRVLVRRRRGNLVGPRGEELVVMPGEPVISLFTGIGGFDIGLERAGFSVVVQHEWDYQCCQTLIGNRPAFFPNAALIQGDLQKTPTSMLLEEAGLMVGEATMVCGGPPCQGFSTANVHTQRGEYDWRNDLVFQLLRVVDEAKPKFFLFENVPGFVRFNKGEYFRAFLERAYGCYYELVYGLLDACDYGVPQTRIRFFCMGTRRDMAEVKGQIASLPRPENFSSRDIERLRIYSAGPIFAEEAELLTHPPGIRYFPDREVLVPPQPTINKNMASGVDAGKTKKYIEFFRKLRREEPDRIVDHPKGGE